MSSIFYDHLIVFEEIDIVIKKTTQTKEEQEELWNLVDEIIHHRVVARILDHLPQEHHEEFLDKFHKRPHDEGLITYLNEKTQNDIESEIKSEIDTLKKEILKEING